MKRILVIASLAVVLLTQALQGVTPQKWETRSKDDFLKGKFDGISVSYEGILSLSPKEEKLEGPAEEFYLSLLITPEDVIYLGTGHGGKIYRISKGGAPELYFQVPEMDICCLAQDKKGNLYAGTSPNGKIWKITDKAKGEPFFDPREKYIWDLMFSDKGTLLAAVGESGGIYEINQKGEGSLIFKAEQNHILCMRFDRNGDIIAGSGGRGLLHRIPQGKRASVIFESSYEEIKSIALDAEGNIYVAAGGTVIKPKKEETTPLPVKAETEVAVSVSAVSTESTEIPSLSLSQKQPGALYKIDPQGIAKRLWNSDEELIYSLLWNEEEKRLIFGTGNQGRVYAVDKDEKVSLLIQKKSEQVYGLVPFRSRIYMLANNPSSLSIISPEQLLSGEYLSRVMDTKIISSWGNIEWQAETPSGTMLQLQSRSGNSSEPDESWSDWSPPYQKKEGEKVLSPKSRYIQFKAMLKTQSGKVSPLLQRVTLFYLQTNIMPAITELKLLAANEVYLRPPEQEEVIWGLETDVGEQAKIKEKDKVITLAMAKKAQKKGFQTITWEAEDENGDNLLFSIQIRREDESQWRVLKEKWTDTVYTFDTISFPDGVYFLKIVASDSPSNPAGMDLKSEKVSQPLVIDNSLPVIKNLLAVKDKDKLVLTFQAEDSFSSIEEVKYLIRPDEWKSIFPEDGICDSKQESFKVTLSLLPGSENLITIKVKDSRANVGVYRQTF
jgi:hypothetical protein